MKWQTKVCRGVKQNSCGVKHFPEGVKKNVGGVNPPNPPPQKIRPWIQPKQLFALDFYEMIVDLASP